MLLDVAQRIGTSALCGAWYGAAYAQGAISKQHELIEQRSICELVERGFTVVPNWLPSDVVHAVAEDMLALEGRSRDARVGTKSTRRQDETIRNSKLISLHPPLLPLNEGSVGARLQLSGLMQRLCAELNRAELGLPSLSPLHTELGYVAYPVGGFYGRHVDAPPHVMHARTGFPEPVREVSVLLYLDRGWEAGWGGELRIHVDEGAEVAPHLDVRPEGGTLVLMKSDRIVHEVRETRRARHCVVGWLRSHASRPKAAAVASRASLPGMRHGGGEGSTDDELPPLEGYGKGRFADESESGRDGDGLDLDDFRKWRDIMLPVPPLSAERGAPGLSRGGAVGGPGRRPTPMRHGPARAGRSRSLRWVGVQVSEDEVEREIPGPRPS